MELRFSVLISLAAVVSACSPGAGGAVATDHSTGALTGQEEDVLATFNAHVAAFRSGDLDAVMGDFGSSSVVITADGVFEGPAQIRALYDGLLTEFGSIDDGDSPGITFDISHVRHDMLFVTWHGESINLVFPFGTDTFIINGNTIARQTIAFSPPTVK